MTMYFGKNSKEAPAPVEYVRYTQQTGQIVICKVLEERVAEWLKPLIKDAAHDQGLCPEEMDGARDLLEHLWNGCVFESDGVE